MNYWNKKSLLLPNVFRLTSILDDDTQHLLEYQDLSSKEILVQGQGVKGDSLFQMKAQFTYESLVDSPVSSICKKIKKTSQKCPDNGKKTNTLLRHD